jgi:hypothetical protein
MRRLKYVAMGTAVGTVLCGGGQVFADFLNGGFEDGTFNNWTMDGGTWAGNNDYNWSGDPGKSAIVTAGMDPYTGNQLNMVAYGTYSARVNNYDNNYHFSTITQSAANWMDTHVYFAWAAVLEQPGHPPSTEPHMRVTLTDDTSSTILYNAAYYTDILPNVHDGIGDWKYTDWTIMDLDLTTMQGFTLGDTLSLTVLASDCAQRAHGGYIYVDGFGGESPDGVPDAGSTALLLGAALTGLGFLRQKLG